MQLPQGIFLIWGNDLGMECQWQLKVDHALQEN